MTTYTNKDFSNENYSRLMAYLAGQLTTIPDEQWQRRTAEDTLTLATLFQDGDRSYGLELESFRRNPHFENTGMFRIRFFPSQKSIDYDIFETEVETEEKIPLLQPFMDTHTRVSRRMSEKDAQQREQLQQAHRVKAQSFLETILGKQAQ
ncbi:MAG TPA: hypothetical protein VJB87_01795 [Candidatus Nanoarchaeia archaeon]|nr:hypothetical protein [Candidatus Nanoarchaeia archaeon]